MGTCSAEIATVCVSVYSVSGHTKVVPSRSLCGVLVECNVTTATDVDRTQKPDPLTGESQLVERDTRVVTLDVQFCVADMHTSHAGAVLVCAVKGQLDGVDLGDTCTAHSQPEPGEIEDIGEINGHCL
jgi:hypothetical protein